MSEDTQLPAEAPDQEQADEFEGRNDLRDQFIQAVMNRKDRERDFFRLVDVLHLHNRVGTEPEYNLAKTVDRAADLYVRARMDEQRLLSCLLLKEEEERWEAEKQDPAPDPDPAAG